MTAQGDSVEHWYAVPPEAQPEAAFASVRGLLLISHVVTGFEPEARAAFPGQAHDGLQQSPR